MPRDNPPPLTSRQAKRRYQKRGKKFEFTPSQYRAAERRSELEERRKQTLAKEQRKKENKRKREGKEERERETKRQQLAEGRISIEDTWGKVGASQPRLIAFFKIPESPTVERPTNSPRSGSSNQDETESVGEEFTGTVKEPAFARSMDKKLMNAVLRLLHSFHGLSISNDFCQQPAMQDITTEKRDPTRNTEPLAPPGQIADPDQDLLDAQLSFSQSFWDFVIAEDETAGRQAENHAKAAQCASTSPTCLDERCKPLVCEPQEQEIKISPLKRKADDSHHSSFCSPSKSMRSVLSEMTRSHVNVRAQEKPDVTSTPKPGSALPSPRQERKAETPADVLALISTQDLEDDLNAPLNDKENQDPWLPASSDEKGTSSRDMKNIEAATRPQKQSKPSHPDDFSIVEDFVDLFDFEFETGAADEFDDDGIDDAALAGISTQIHAARNTLVNDRGSPKKAKATLNAQSAQPQTVSKPPMLPPTLPKQDRVQDQSKPITRSKSGLTKTNSYSFDCLEDEALVELADQIEAETERTRRPAKKGRRIPWLHQRCSQISEVGVEDEEAEETLTSSPELEV